MNMLRDLWGTVASDPVTLAAALMMAAALLALLLIATPAQGAATQTPTQKRPARARSLAAHGAPATEIARRTGLSRDAVAILLGATPADDARKARPGAARFSAMLNSKREQPMPERRI